MRFDGRKVLYLFYVVAEALQSTWKAAFFSILLGMNKEIAIKMELYFVVNH